MKLLPTLLVLMAALVDQSLITAAQPNILFIVVDDLRDTLGCYGNHAVKTPNIDRLASRGVVFERAYVQYPVCNPSRSSFLTGLRPDQTGVTDNTTLLRDQLPDVVTFPQSLKDHGWRSAAFGKIFHLGGGRNETLRARWMDLPASWETAEAFKAPEGVPHRSRALAGHETNAQRPLIRHQKNDLPPTPGEWEHRHPRFRFV